MPLQQFDVQQVIKKQATAQHGITKPYIVLIGGFKAKQHMHRHWGALLNSWGYTHILVYDHHYSSLAIAQHILEAQQPNQPLVLLGYSQGGFQVVKVARHLARYHRLVDVLVCVGAGGLGRWYPQQWLSNVRQIPHNVKHTINAFATHDEMGTDTPLSCNYAVFAQQNTLNRIDNIAIALHGAQVHLTLARVWPACRQHPQVKSQLVFRVQQAIQESHCG